MLVALLLFRTFDILKPGPIRWAEHRLAGAWGVMVDDVIAGLLAAAVLQLALLGFASLTALPAP